MVGRGTTVDLVIVEEENRTKATQGTQEGRELAVPNALKEVAAARPIRRRQGIIQSGHIGGYGSATGACGDDDQVFYRARRGVDVVETTRSSAAGNNAVNLQGVRIGIAVGHIARA